VLYLSLFYNAFKDKSAGETKESLLKRLQELEEKFRVLTSENEALKAARAALEHSSMDLNKKLVVLSEEKTQALSSKTEVTTSLGHLKETYESDTTKLHSKISELTDQISLLKSSSDSSVTNLQNEKDRAAKERDGVREELKKAREQLTKEKEELQAQHDDLEANIVKNKKMKEELEEIRKQQQENHQKTINVLRKHLLQHVQDMHVWKPLLEADREFQESDLYLKSDSDIEKLSMTLQVAELDKAIIEDNTRLSRLVREREVEAAEVLSVNIGKKKKRIKKHAEVDDMSAGDIGGGTDEEKERKKEKVEKVDKAAGTKKKPKK